MDPTNEPRNLHVQLQYLKDEHHEESTAPSTSSSRQHELCIVLGKPELIHDVRGIDQEFELDQNGFRYVKAPTGFKGCDSDIEIREALIPEMEELLRREVQDCDEIVVIDPKQSRFAPKPVNIDLSKAQVESIVREKYEIKADYLLAGRVRLINIWKPIRGIVHEYPLAVADAKGVDVQKDVSFSNAGESPGLARYRDGYQWYYMSEQTEEDVLLFKTYDSKPNVPHACLHTTFAFPCYLTDTAPTETTTLQALVFTYPDKIATQVELLRAQLDTLQAEVTYNRDMVKAVLELRQWESRKMGERFSQLLSDRNHARADTMSLSNQLNYLEEWIMSLYMSSNSSPHNNMLAEQIQHFVSSAPRLRERYAQDAQALESLDQARNMYGPLAEVMILGQQLQAQKMENERLKAHINAQVDDRMEAAFRSAVAAGIRHERLKDAVVLRDLRQEKQRLQRALDEQGPLKW